MLSLRVLDRYLLRESLASVFGIVIVLLLIMLSTRFTSLLAEAAAGNIPQDLLLRAVGLSALQFLMILLPIAQLLGVMMTLGRLYRDNEVAAMLGCGVGLGQLFRPFILSASALAVLATLLSMWVGPWAERTAEHLKRDARRLVQYTPFEAGQFKSVGGGKAVFYTQSLSADGGNLGHVFARIEEEQGESILVAQSGRQSVDFASGDRLVSVEHGRRYSPVDGDRGWDVVEFDSLSTRITPPEFLYAPSRRRAMTTSSLLGSSDPRDRAELQWRLSSPISLLLLTWLALPLAHTRPRSGRYGRLVVGLLVYLVYANLLGVAQNMMQKSEVPAWLGLWWVHALLATLALGLLAHRDGWLTRWRR